MSTSNIQEELSLTDQKLKMIDIDIRIAETKLKEKRKERRKIVQKLYLLHKKREQIEGIKTIDLK